jgi:uncharacterized protein YciI
MNYFIINAAHKKPLPVSQTVYEDLLPGHKEFIQRGIKDNRVLLAGPKNTGGGGFIIMRAETKSDAEDFISTDPFFQHGIQHYEINEFIPYDYQDCLGQWV